MSILFPRIAAALCFLAIALGAFGAHWLKPTLEAHGLTDVWNKAVLYHFIHAIALFRTRALRNGESRCVVVAFYRHNYFQRKFVCDGADPAGAGFVGRGHTAWRLVFFSRLGVVGYFAGQVIL